MGVITIGFKNVAYRHTVIDLCPTCNRLSEMTGSTAIEVVSGTHHYETVVKCGYVRCGCYSIMHIKRTMNGLTPEFNTVKVIPERSDAKAFHQAVRAISPVFVEVYHQAEKARQLGLAYIAGPGFRKAFEFLIKDYAITLAPSKADEIKSQFVGSIVKNHIGDGRIVAVAERALWVGNDETHYERKWEDRDINDLIVLIDTTVRWIETDHYTKTYVAEMPDGKK